MTRSSSAFTAPSAVTTSYTPVRDDAGIRSLSLNERDFLFNATAAAVTASSSSSSSTASAGGRSDGRKPHELRHIKLASLGRWEDGAECTVQWGMTRVTCLVSCSISTPPSLDRPNEGMLYFSVDLSPMASTSFVHAQPATTAPRGSGVSSNSISVLPALYETHQKLLSNRILRTLERVVLTSGVMDLEALCIVSAQWVWKLHVSVTVLDMGGNLLDASVLSCMAALSHYRQPQVSLGTTVTNTTSTTSASSPSLASASAAMTPPVASTISPTLISPDFQQATPLPLHHIPLTISFGLLPLFPEAASTSSSSTATPSKHRSSSSSCSTSVVAWMDPTDREELVTTGTLTFAMNVHGEVCWLDVHGCELAPNKLMRECGPMAQTAIVKLCRFLEESIQDAEEQAQRDRLQRLQRQQQVQQQSQQDKLLQAATAITPLTLSNTMEAVTLPPLPSTDVQVPFWQGISEVDVGLENVEVGPVPHQQKQQYQEEEEYRKMALDYSLGHVAAKVKENRPDQQQPQNDTTAKASSLLAALLKSAAAQPLPALATSSPQSFAVAATSAVTKSSSSSTSHPHVSAAAAKTAAMNTSRMDDQDDDEEPTTMVWQSEFASLVPLPPQQPTPLALSPRPVVVTATVAEATGASTTPKQQLKHEGDEVNVDDLMMAIKTKKKKKSKK